MFDASEAGAAAAAVLGDAAFFARGDVRDAAAVGSAMEETVRRFGKLDLAVSCAGLVPPETAI